MTEHDDARLARLLSDAVSDVEPEESLDRLRRRTSTARGAARGSARRPWPYAVGGAVLATAAAVTAIALAGATPLGDERVVPRPSAPSTPASPAPSLSPSQTPSPTPSPTPSQTPSPITGSTTVAAYYLGDTPRGTRLFREFRAVQIDDGLSAALLVLQAEPADPDYRNPWPDGSFDSVSDTGEVVRVSVADASLRPRPAELDEAEAGLAVEQVVLTLQAAVGRRAPVQFTYAGNPIDQVYGVPTSEPLSAAASDDVLALVSISDPAEGSVVSGSFRARGVANSYEATVPWEVRRGDEVVLDGFATATGWMDRLYPWETEVDVSALAPGRYTFVATTSDPSDGEGFGPDADTRTIVVE